jgi:tripartite-type tricarboxylate transporter receptor subunit TctC
VRLVVGFAPGGSTDIIARTLQPPLTEIWGQPVVVENRAGASGVLATENVVRSPADGHHLAFVISTHATAPALMARMPFDPVRDVTPIALVARLHYILVAPANSPFRSLADLLAEARRRPGALAYGSTGIGGSNHLAMEALLRRAGAEMTHIPYRGGGPSVAAVTSGEIAALFGTWPTVLPPVQSGQLRALAVSTPRRVAALPDVPATAETFPGFEGFEWYGVVGPAGLAPAQVATLRDGLARAVARPEVAARFQTLGIEADVGSPESFAALIRSEIEAHGRLIRELGIRAE